MFLALWSWGFSLVAGGLFVLPVMAVAPRLRAPSVWLATVWGIAVAWLSIELLALAARVLDVAMIGWAHAAIAGGTAGASYALLVRHLPRTGSAIPFALD